MLTKDQQDQVFALIDLPEVGQLSITTSKISGFAVTVFCKNFVSPQPVIDALLTIFSGLEVNEKREYPISESIGCTAHCGITGGCEIRVLEYKKAPAEAEANTQDDSTTLEAVAQ